MGAFDHVPRGDTFKTMKIRGKQANNNYYYTRNNTTPEVGSRAFSKNQNSDEKKNNRNLYILYPLLKGRGKTERDIS